MTTVRDDQAGLDAAVAALRAGLVVVVPTDTVYGLAVSPTEESAVQSVFAIKGRPEGMHLPVLASNLEQVDGLGVAWTSAATRLARRWWPGPLTLVFGFTAGAPRPDWLSGREEVAVRIPDHHFLRSLLDRTGVLLVTSANPHGAPTPLTARQVTLELDAAVDLVVDGGTLHEVPSTLVNVHGPMPSVAREGAVPRHAVDATVGGRA